MAMKVDTEVILDTAGNIHSLNVLLKETLDKSRETVNSLTGVWTGKAAEATIGAYNEFSNKYFEEYEDMLEQYVAFLRQGAAEGYADVEEDVTKEAENIMPQPLRKADEI